MGSSRFVVPCCPPRYIEVRRLGCQRRGRLSWDPRSPTHVVAQAIPREALGYEGSSGEESRVNISSRLPVIEEVLALGDEELGLFLLQHLVGLEEGTPGGLNLHNFLLQLIEYPEDFRPVLTDAFTEAWTWLEREGMLAPRGGRRDFFYVTKRGRALLEHANLEAYRRGNLLRGMNLEPTLARKVHPTYLRGDYDTAVFQAFKEVEVRVRTAANFGDERIGVKLMRDAFQADNGPLADLAQERGEREALSHLFAGAIGAVKNPSSHRNTDLDDPQEAAEAILLANYLLRIVERRTNMP